MIELRHVSRTYIVGGRPVHALRDVSFRIEAGESVAVMGPSGSGKSTLLHILGCLDRPSEGHYLLDGRDVSGLDEAELSRIRLHRIGFVFQHFHLIPRLTAAANVEMPMMFAGIPARKRRELALAALTAVGLAARADHRPDQLSGGEMQRVAIARAVVMQPAVLLADEPTGNLDSQAGGEVLALLQNLNARGMTLVVVTHDPAVGGRCRRLIRLGDGAVLEDRTGAAA